MESEKLKPVLEALFAAADRPLSVNSMFDLFTGDLEQPNKDEIRKAIHELIEKYAHGGLELKQVASGFRLQVKPAYEAWVARLWDQKPPRYSRALMETLALIAYRQPITRGEIEDIRGVGVSTSIIRTLQEREWIRVVGHRDVPGKPALFGTTKTFLDSFDLQNLDDLPTLAEIRDMENLEPELQLEPVPPAADVRDPQHEASNESADESNPNLDQNQDDQSQVAEDIAENDISDESFANEDFDAEFEDMNVLEAKIDNLLEEVAVPEEPDNEAEAEPEPTPEDESEIQDSATSDSEKPEK